MRDFSWKYFAMTGDVDAYLLYREVTGSEPELAAAALANDKAVPDEEDE